MGQLQRLLQIPAYWTHQVRFITLLRLRLSDSILKCLTAVNSSSQQAGKEAQSCPRAVHYCSSSRAGHGPGESLEFSEIFLSTDYQQLIFFFQKLH